MTNRTADVVVIGGGVMGTSLVYHLAQTGMKTTLVEKKFLGAGGTGKSTAVIRMHYDNEPEARLAWASFHVYKNWADVVGGECGFTRTGFLMFVGPEDADHLRANVAMQQGVGINTRLVTADEVREIAPAFWSDDVVVAAYEPESGYADPSTTSLNFSSRARDLGAQVLQGVAATGIRCEGDRVTGVLSGDGLIATRNVVCAAGPWSVALAKMVGVDLPIVPERHQVATAYRPADLHAGHPTVIDSALAMYFRPETGNLTLIGTGAGQRGVDPDHYNESVDNAIVLRAGERIARRIPAMERAISRGGWSGVYDMTPDEHAILDQAGPEGFFIAAGFSGTGFKLAPAIGEAMSELVVGGKSETHDLTPFRLSRFAEGRPLVSEHPYAAWWS